MVLQSLIVIEEDEEAVLSLFFHNDKMKYTFTLKNLEYKLQITTLNSIIKMEFSELIALKFALDILEYYESELGENILEFIEIKERWL